MHIWRGTVWLTLLGGLLAALAGCVSLPEERPPDIEQIGRSLVRIHVTTQSPSYAEPWKGGAVSGGVGSGFVIAGKRIMTNAHVVSDARIILLERDGDPRKYPAKVLHVAHDSDLAMLAPEDEGFFDGMAALEFGPLPKLDSTVGVYGYPIGGARMSVTRGVVSRIEFRTYSHSALDSHLTVQIDAAINPGNSGGPVLQGNKVVGVVFQGFSGTVAQNIGYMIPTPVVERFLKDVEDDTYDGYAELAVYYQPLTNDDHREVLGLPDNDLGVVVNDVLKIGSAAGKLREGDILLAIDEHPIYSDGHIRLGGENTQMEEIVERKFHGDVVRFKILRDGREQEVEVTLKSAWPYRIFARSYDRQPHYIMFGGLVFQPLERNVVDAFETKDMDILYWYTYFVLDELYRERPEPVILTSILPDGINAHVRHMSQSIVDKVNGVTISRLSDLAEALSKPEERYVIQLLNQSRPIVLYAEALADAHERIKRNYGVLQDLYLGPPTLEETAQ